MRPCDKEDLAQEKLLAELEGRAFDARAFSRDYLRYSEVSCADVEEVQVHVPRSKQKRPVGTFEAQSAAHRDGELRALLSELIARDLTYAQIATELTKRCIPKATWRSRGGWRRWGVRDLLRRQGLRIGQTEGRRRGGRATKGIKHKPRSRERPPTPLCVLVCELRLGEWSYRDIREYLGVSYRCVSRSVDRGIGDEGKQERYRKLTTASSARTGPRRCG